MGCEIILPDGEEDYQRRKKRAAEFSSRLSRNYLYQLSREVIVDFFSLSLRFVFGVADDRFGKIAKAECELLYYRSASTVYF